MPRRSRSNSSNKNNLGIYIIAGVILIGALIAGKFVLDQRAVHFKELTEFPMSDYKENPNSLSGNKYRISGKVGSKIKYTANDGQLISFLVEDSGKGTGSVGILIPPTVGKGVNLENGQSYIFKVEVNREGVLVALNVKAM